jgi:hypothetical protein
MLEARDNIRNVGLLQTQPCIRLGAISHHFSFSLNPPYPIHLLQQVSLAWFNVTGRFEYQSKTPSSARD